MEKKITMGVFDNCMDEIPDDFIIIYSELLISFKQHNIDEKKITIGKVEKLNNGMFKNVNLNIISIGTSLFVDFLNCSIKSEKNNKTVNIEKTIKNV